MTRDEAINTLANFKVYISGGGVTDKKANEALDLAIATLVNLPSADRPEGEWIWQLANNGWVDHICSICGYTENTDIHVSLGWKYCPNCGAEMKGAYDETY